MTLLTKRLFKHLFKKKQLLIGICLAIILITILFSFRIGYYPLSLEQIWHAFLAKFDPSIEVSSQAVTIFWQIRLPRVLAALLIGASLSVAGSVYQGMFHNPLVSPDILGVSAGAGLGASIAIFLGLPSFYTQLLAFLGGIMAVLLCYLISQHSVHSHILSLVLTGTMIGALCNSVITMIKYVSDPNDVLQQITFWLMGSLTKVDMSGILWSLGPMMIGMMIIFILRWRINLLSLNDEESRAIGINPVAYRALLIIASTLLSAAAVCLGGLIGWVGLMIPHMARRIFGADYKYLVPGCFLIGGLFLLIMDNIARAAFSLELPIGVVTAFIGAPFFVLLILRKRG